MFISRSLAAELRTTAATRPSLILTGARQVGKTTLLRATFPEAKYLSFDNILAVASAREAPLAFLRRLEGQVILDEVQYVPELFPALKQLIDEDREAVGRWLLTGSQRFELMKGVAESLAGRIGVLHLESLSSCELRGAGLLGSARAPSPLIAGGYPELWASPAIDRGPWFESYIRTYIERDLKDLVRVKDLVSFRRFLGLAALRSGDLANYSDLALSCGVSNNTIKTWVAALETSGILYILPPFHSNAAKRLIKTPKLYFADTGLLCALLGIEDEAQLEARDSGGRVWENFVLAELVKEGRWQPGRTLFFYRDHGGTELDFVLQGNSGLTLVEAKYTERLRAERLGFERATELPEHDIVARRVAAPTGQAASLPFRGFEVYDPRYYEFNVR